MNILIVGAGKVGEALIENLSKEKHDIIVVDEKIELVEKLVDTYDIIGTVGNGASYDVLINAKIQKADMLIAVTNSDEINMLCCIIGKKLGVKDTIARVRNPEYSLQLDLLQQEMGIDMVINPEFEAANDIFRMLQFPSASNVESFAKGRVNIVEGKVSANSDLIGVSLTELRKSSKLDILICVVTRDSQVLIPRGDFVLQEGDGIYVTGTTQQLILFFKQQGVYKKNVRDVLMIGGGKISYYLAKKLIKQGIQVKIIERHERRCLELSQKLKEATIVHNDGTLHEVLDEDNFQGNAVVNYTEREVPYTRIIEHKHFEKGTQEKTVITREYSVDWKRGDEPYYPINDEKNNAIYQQYLEEAKGKDVIFCGRLADYKYYDMHVVIERALNVVREELGE